MTDDFSAFFSNSLSGQNMRSKEQFQLVLARLVTDLVEAVSGDE